MIKQRILPVFLTFFASFATLAASFEEITVSGTLFPIARTTICSQVSARMQELFVGTGDRVEKGQALARLDPVMIELDAKQLEIASKLATITLEEAQENYARMKNLYEKENEGHSSIPKKAFDEAKNQLKKSELLWQQAQVNLQRGNERLNETQIRAPYSGVITKCFLSLGDSVSVAPATPIFEMIDETKVVFEFSLPQTMLEGVKKGLIVSSSLFEGKIATIFPQVDMANRTLTCRVEIDNKEFALKPGIFLTAKLKKEE